MAVIRSLRDGRRLQVAVHTLIVHDDLGLAKTPTCYPSLPDMRLYRRVSAAVLVRTPTRDANPAMRKRRREAVR